VLVFHRNFRLIVERLDMCWKGKDIALLPKDGMVYKDNAWQLDVSEGWGWLLNSRKWHYFVEGHALCGRWFAPWLKELEHGKDDHPDNCAACKRKLKKRQALERDVFLKNPRPPEPPKRRKPK